MIKVKTYFIGHEAHYLTLKDKSTVEDVIVALGGLIKYHWQCNIKREGFVPINITLKTKVRDGDIVIFAKDMDISKREEFNYINYLSEKGLLNKTTMENKDWIPILDILAETKPADFCQSEAEVAVHDKWVEITSKITEVLDKKKIGLDRETITSYIKTRSNLLIK